MNKVKTDRYEIIDPDKASDCSACPQCYKLDRVKKLGIMEGESIDDWLPVCGCERCRLHFIGDKS